MNGRSRLGSVRYCEDMLVCVMIESCLAVARQAWKRSNNDEKSRTAHVRIAIHRKR